MSSTSSPPPAPPPHQPNINNNHHPISSSSSSSISSGHSSPSLSPLHITPSPLPPPSTTTAAAPAPANHLSIASSSSSSSISSDHHNNNNSPLHEISPHDAAPSPPPPTPPNHPNPPVVNRLIRDDALAVVTGLESVPPIGFAEERGTEESEGKEKGGGPRVRKSVMAAAAKSGRGRRKRRGEGLMMRRAEIGLRVFEFVACLVSFSVLASDQNRGWALDSFNRYLEFRYSISVTILGFAWSGYQTLYLVYQLTTSKTKSRQFFRCCLDFATDQILAYLLASASSSAAARTDDWITSWGEDKFPTMAGASVGMSFLAFLAFALSSVISGYLLCTHSYT